jgi:hypothetical protein
MGKKKEKKEKKRKEGDILQSIVLLFTIHRLIFCNEKIKIAQKDDDL